MKEENKNLCSVVQLQYQYSVISKLMKCAVLYTYNTWSHSDISIHAIGSKNIIIYKIQYIHKQKKIS